MTRKLVPAFVPLLALSLLPLGAEEPVDLGMMSRIRNEGFRHSQAMDIAYHLTEVLGPRLTGSPEMKAANDWTRQQLADWGLADAHLEGYDFGRGWSYTGVQVRLVAPRNGLLLALPKAWSPATQGAVRGPVMRMKIETEKDLDAFRGKVAGKILLTDDPRKFEEPDTPALQRYSADGLTKMGDYSIPPDRDPVARRQGAYQRYKLRRAINEFLVKEKALATIDPSGVTNGIVRVTGGSAWAAGEPEGVPAFVMAAEHYNELLRLLDAGEPVELSVQLDAQFTDPGQAYDTVAEIPGTDKAGEVVMVGAHLDSWHAGTGATDNAAGCVVAMEAVRILKALGVKPRRTIRIALWSGEEQGLLGSAAYVKQHFAAHPESTDPKQKELPERFRDDTWPLQLKPEHAKLSAYFNLDNGTGKVRGIYAEENAAVVPIFQAWLAPFADLGATMVTSRTTGATDHVSFDTVGLPGFQFIQDEMDYMSRTHHTNLDTYDHLSREDLMQASVVMAGFLYDAAMRPELLPRKPLPQAPPPQKPKKTAQPKETAP